MPHAIEVNDRNGALLMLLLNEDTLPEVTKVLVDGAYTGERFEEMVWHILGARLEVVKRSELHAFAVIPRRWVVGRSFAWLAKCRQLWKNCERKLETSVQLALVFLALLLWRH
jgi:transposase